MKCPNCQAELKDTAKFCTECGTPIPAAEAIPESPAAPSEELMQATPEEPIAAPAEASALEPTQEPVAVPAPTPEPEPEAPVAEQPASEPAKEPESGFASVTDSRLLLTTAQYFWLTVLFHIPIIGFIFLFVWGCGKPRNLSLKRYSLAILVMRLLGWLLYLALTVLLLLGMNNMIPGFSITFPAM